MKRRRDTSLALAVFGLAIAQAGTCLAGTIYVDADVPGGGDGASWETAYNRLEAGIGAAVPGDEVWVAEGTYRNPNNVFRLRRGVAVYGGFAGGEQERSQRDWIAHETTLTGDGSRPVVRADDSTGAVLDGFTIRDGRNDGEGGGIILWQSSPTIRNCVIIDCHAEFGGGLHAEGGSPRLESCRFEGNSATIAAGAFWIGDLTAVWMTDCTVTNSSAFTLAGGLLIGESAVVTNCAFVHNVAETTGGALGLGFDVTAAVTNCVFSRNQAEVGAGLISGGVTLDLVNCTFANNNGLGLRVDSEPVTITNCVVWGNTPAQLDAEPDDVTVSYSDIEGGWPGPFNLDEDPRFVQPGVDDLRLGLGSPCVDAGNNDAVPPGVDEDLAGAPRIQNGVVDLGAYEGAFEQLPPGAEAEDVDRGDVVILVPSGGGFDPENETLVIFRNVSGPDDASVAVTELPRDRHPGARGFGSLGSSVVMTTTVDDGAFLATVMIAFGPEELDGLDPFAPDLTTYDESVDNWSIAASRNTARSPGHGRTIGDRIEREGPGPWGLTQQLGDYGVFWNVQTQRGFAWANVDHTAGDFAFGDALCPADARQPPDDVVDFDDLLVVLDNWGAGPGPHDVNDDDVVDAEDIFAILSAWGPCPDGAAPRRDPPIPGWDPNAPFEEIVARLQAWKRAKRGE